MDVRFCRNLRREAQIALEGILIRSNGRSGARPENSCFSFAFDLHGSRHFGRPIAVNF